MTHAVSPIWALAWRTPCRAMEPTVANAASWGETPSGTATQRLVGTQLISAWRAILVPGARHELTDRELLGPPPDLDDDAGERVAER